MEPGSAVPTDPPGLRPAALTSDGRQRQYAPGRQEQKSSGTTFRTLKLAIRFSLREMRSGLSGFLIFLTCIALGVAAIGGVNSVARSISLRL